jgi:uncharacterized membrane-anchored protein
MSLKQLVRLSLNTANKDTTMAIIKALLATLLFIIAVIVMVGLLALGAIVAPVLGLIGLVVIVFFGLLAEFSERRTARQILEEHDKD